MKYTRVYRFRLTDEEEDRFVAQAAERGVSKADLIREALGWETRTAPSLTPGSDTTAMLDGAAETPTADPAEEPGKAAIEELAQRTRERLKA